jgi:hypothetical protein
VVTAASALHSIDLTPMRLSSRVLEKSAWSFLTSSSPLKIGSVLLKRARQS